MPYGHASMLLLGEGSEATEPYNKYANLFKKNQVPYILAVTEPNEESPNILYRLALNFVYNIE